ncbi:methylenetetrahydrofolate reductase C-terminal domain-containing protein [Hoeflea ulvae]|uniref:Methylenetetrahydrofolate reductase C-terminal domain-containing protein n=1 Tax=Hoeflea ulvae TaxID=2983764 RepID=A0ABT3YJC6_9HYPH|nr:methylenetetrahydrofolate reductase C-terminal domain-containing protein [Hoeflea ulvae]MCY0095922.1 methylenetetrahydrofolate reductase C-terminal domain-containing protein [Hoeflea ulvae]
MADQPTTPTQASLNKKAVQKTAYKPSGVSATGRNARSFAVRLWAVRHARGLEWFYGRFADLFLRLHPVWKAVGYQRAEKPVKFIEKHVKGFLFDCRMCGQCVLSSTGMSCPMNCPKQLRNGPCGGVRANGNCEVEPDMPCVWVQAWSGSQKMVENQAILAVQKPVDQSLRETSSWLRVTAQAAALAEAAKPTEPA